MRPILPQDVPTGGRCTQAHTVSRVQALPKGPFPHLSSRLSTRSYEPKAIPNRSSPGTFNALFPLLGCFRCPQGFCFLTLTWLFGSCCPAHLSVTVQLFPITPFNSLVDCLAEGMPVRINQRRHPTVVLNVKDLSLPTSFFGGTRVEMVKQDVRMTRCRMQG